MQRVGIGGVLIMEVDQGAPKGPADFGGAAWRELFKHVCAEGHRLGLEINMNNDAGWCGSGGPWITPDLAMQKVVWSETNVAGPARFEAVLPQPKAVADYYRDIVVLAFPTPAGLARIEDVEAKSALVPRHIRVTADFESIPAEQVIAQASVVNLNSCVATNGRVIWDVPPGKWTIMRFGHTPTGADNHPAPEPGRGLESDKLSKVATEAAFNGLMKKLIGDSKALAGKTLVSTHIDSWETGSQNWTPQFREEFRQRRGYDPLSFLVVMSGRVVDSVEISERFLWDVRQTVSDLLVENYAGHLRHLAHQNGLRLSIEAYDGTPCDDLTYAGQADEPMAEFWSWGYNTAYSCVEMSSAAHVYGRRILGAEAFTANDQEKWLHHPATIKTLGDWAFCEGINRFVFHRYALQPWAARAPGMSMGPWGLHYERTQTWWDESAAWHEYLARCQYLLRQGLFVADICFLEPEGSPRRFSPTMPWRSGNTPDRPRYNFDGCSPQVLLTRMKVTDGRLVLPDGLSYRVLVLPQVETMTPRLLRRIKELVDAGATIIGPAPIKSPSLEGYPKCDAEVKALAAELWRTDGSTASVGRKQRGTKGAGHVLWNDSYKTSSPQKISRPIESAKWIWYQEGNPAVAAPVGERYFRRVLDLSGRPPIASAKIFFTCDNSFRMWINGAEAISGDNFNEVFTAAVSKLLKAGTNVLAITGVNGAEQPNPAGVIGVLQIRFADNSTFAVDTDARWEATRHPPAGWHNDPVEGDAWQPAMELGSFGMAPWGKLDKASPPPYVFPDFQAIAGLLQGMGVAPDFEGDSQLRFTHRQDGNTDIYFVANSQTNWLLANCAFRVEGKLPELWDPMNGRITRPALYREVDGRTLVQIPFEPAGSRFVVFRERSPFRGGTSVASSSPVVRVLPTNTLARVSLDEAYATLALDPGGSIGAAPAFELTADQSGHLDALVWCPGHYEIQPASGRAAVVDVSDLPAALELAGPWEVSFAQGWGAPDHARWDRLIDWTQSSDPGVKYFSGRADYVNSFTVPQSFFGPDQRAFLDLGTVDIIANVRLNGKELGTLWKAPFRVEITGAIKPGQNRLEVKLVNLWVNRMIGDEQLPEDSERNGNGTLKKWPAWLDADQPSPAGRFTFTSWRLWKKDSPLQPSGLLGPVKIIPAKVVHLRRESNQ